MERLTQQELDLACGAVLYRLVAFKQGLDAYVNLHGKPLSEDEAQIEAHQSLYEKLLDLSDSALPTQEERRSRFFVRAVPGREVEGPDPKDVPQ